MGRAETFEILKDLVANDMSIDAEAITEDASFTDDLGLDSLDLLEVMNIIEDHFSITIPDDDFESLHTVRDILDEFEKLGVE